MAAGTRNPAYYFAFGMNMVPRLMQHYEATEPRRAWLDGYRLVYRTFADVTVAPLESVPGVLWTVTDYTMQEMDYREGVSSGLYRRAILPVRLDGGERVDAWVYVMTDEHVRQFGGREETYGAYLMDMVEGRESVGHTVDDIPLDLLPMPR